MLNATLVNKRMITTATILLTCLYKGTSTKDLKKLPNVYFPALSLHFCPALQAKMKYTPAITLELTFSLAACLKLLKLLTGVARNTCGL
jgi:hypothetical protein